MGGVEHIGSIGTPNQVAPGSILGLGSAKKNYSLFLHEIYLQLSAALRVNSAKKQA